MRIDIEGLRHYDISKKGIVSIAGKIIPGCLAEFDAIIPLTPKRHSTQKPFSLRILYWDTYHRFLPGSALTQYKMIL